MLVQDRDALLQQAGSASKTSPRGTPPGINGHHVLEGAGAKPAHDEDMESYATQPLPSLTQEGQTGHPKASERDRPAVSAGQSALDKLEEMQIAAEHVPGASAAASSTSEGSAAASPASRAAQHDGRPAQDNVWQNMPTQQDGNSAHDHSVQSVPAQQASSPAQGDFLSDLLSSSYVRHAPGTGDMRHDTEGWRCLETSFKVWDPSSVVVLM